jgi:hypothetical protein
VVRDGFSGSWQSKNVAHWSNIREVNAVHVREKAVDLAIVRRHTPNTANPGEIRLENFGEGLELGIEVAVQRITGIRKLARDSVITRIIRGDAVEITKTKVRISEGRHVEQIISISHRFVAEVSRGFR